MHPQPIPSSQPHHVVIVGGGFGGVRCALDLAARGGKTLTVTLISNKPHLEYYGALYKLIGGCPPSEVSLPLSLFFKGTEVRVVEETVVRIDTQKQTIEGASTAVYPYDSLVLALGADTATFGIPGIQEHTMTFRSVHDALELKRHLNATIRGIPQLPAEAQAKAGRFVVIGGGATGIEVASELLVQGRRIAKEASIDPALISVEIIEALPRLMAMLPETMSARIAKRLCHLGVHLRLECSVQKVEAGAVHLNDTVLAADTIVWTAGIKGHPLLAEIAGLEIDKRGRVVVDAFLRAKGLTNVSAIGDNAATQYSGMAQTAIEDAAYVAKTIRRTLTGKPLTPYRPVKPAVALPVGKGWAAVLYGPLRVYGFFGWFLRQAADIRALLTLLSPLRVVRHLRMKRKRQD